MKRHSPDVFSLVTGVIVVGTALVLLNPQADVASLGRYFPLAIMAVGVGLLFSATTGRRAADGGLPSEPSQSEQSQSEPSHPGPSHPGLSHSESGSSALDGSAAQDSSAEARADTERLPANDDR